MLSGLRSRASGPTFRKLVIPQLPLRPCARLFHQQQILGAAPYYGGRSAFRERGRYGGDDNGYSPSRSRFDRSRENRSGRGPQRFPRAMEGEDEILEGTAEERTDYITKFEDLKSSGQINPVLIDTITRRMGFETMTPVQSKTINETLGGIDVIAQARTGTGKTLAFLLPILQSVLAKDPSLAEAPVRSRRRYRDPDIRAVIISPTRELAEQIAHEARQLVKNTSIVVQCAVGGTLKKAGLDSIMNDGCNLLVGTPGRMKDIFSDQFIQLDLSKVNGFVLDEADRLLDDGFFPDIKDIAGFLPPKEDRHNMLFSATVPSEVLGLAKQLLNPNFRFVQTIEKGEAQTHEKVPQNLVTLNGLENMLPALTELIIKQKDRSADSLPFKALVFLNANAECQLYAEIFRHLRRDLGRLLGTGLPVLEMHSRLTQARRTSTAEQFRAAKQAIMFTSDVSARGMDYPNVSHVIQLGNPRTRDFYIHRVGRTGRGEKPGESWLFLSPMELNDAKNTLRKLPLEKNDSLQCATADLTGEVSPEVQEVVDMAKGAAEGADPMLKSEAYRAALGYMSFVGNKRELMDSLNKQARIAWGLGRPPALSASFAEKQGVRGLTETAPVRKQSSQFDYGIRDDRGPGRFGRDRNDRAFGRFGRDRNDRGSGRFDRPFGRSRESRDDGGFRRLNQDRD